MSWGDPRPFCHQDAVNHQHEMEDKPSKLPQGRHNRSGARAQLQRWKELSGFAGKNSAAMSFPLSLGGSVLKGNISPKLVRLPGPNNRALTVAGTNTCVWRCQQPRPQDCHRSPGLSPAVPFLPRVSACGPSLPFRPGQCSCRACSQKGRCRGSFVVCTLVKVPPAPR